MKNPVLPVSNPPSSEVEEERVRLLKAEEKLFKGSAMTKRGGHDLRRVNVPMYTTLRRTAVVFTMAAEWILAGQKYTSSVIGSVGLIVLGAFVAGARNLSFNFYGYFVVFLANITTAIYLATIAHVDYSVLLLHAGLLLKLQHIPEHNSQLSTYSNHMWKSKGSIHHRTWVDDFWRASV